jgi:nitrogen-specific signal transduction histidine kinase
LHAAEAETQRLQTIIDDLPVGVRLVSVPEGMIVLENRAASALFPAETWNSLKPEERASYFRYTRPDGTPIPYEQTPVVRTVREGMSVKEMEMKLTAPGVGTRTLIVSTAPLIDDQGRTIAAVVVTQDVTGMKELDQRKDEFIATAAHELRNPLAAILGYTQLLQKQIPVAGTPAGVPVRDGQAGTKAQ